MMIIFENRFKPKFPSGIFYNIKDNRLDAAIMDLPGTYINSTSITNGALGGIDYLNVNTGIFQYKYP